MDETLNSKLLALLLTEIKKLDESVDIGAYVAGQLEELFDEYVKPIDLPGPDSIIDPLLRAAIRPLVERLLDSLLQEKTADEVPDGA